MTPAPTQRIAAPRVPFAMLGSFRPDENPAVDTNSGLRSGIVRSLGCVVNEPTGLEKEFETAELNLTVFCRRRAL
jgi:hypothetical protein